MNYYNGDDPNINNELGDLLPADFLKMINELLEQLHRAGHTNQGSKIEIVYVAPGGQHVETQVNVAPPCPSLTPDPGLTPGPSPKGEGNYKGEGTYKGRGKGTDRPALPDVLGTEAAMMLWGKAQEAGYVDASYQPLISRTQAALLADAMAIRLSIREKWKVFEALWDRKNMYKDYYQAVDQKQFLPFQEKLRQLFD